jgi:predicted nucleic acid-binding protein
MRVYAESSAVLAAVLGEPEGERARRIIAGADSVMTSQLTLVECDRALHRAVALKKLTEADAAERRALVAASASAWTILLIDDEVVARARQPFPAEPIRALDAIHLATALLGRSAVPGLHLMTLDDRIRAAARGLGFPLQPA